jgi:hypothetical protein
VDGPTVTTNELSVFNLFTGNSYPYTPDGNACVEIDPPDSHLNDKLRSSTTSPTFNESSTNNPGASTRRFPVL